MKRLVKKRSIDMEVVRMTGKTGLSELHPKDWEKLTMTIPLPENYILANIDKMKWSNILRFQRLSPEFIKRYFNYLGTINEIIKYQYVPMDILREHMDEIDIESIRQSCFIDEKTKEEIIKEKTK